MSRARIVCSLSALGRQKASLALFGINDKEFSYKGRKKYRPQGRGAVCLELGDFGVDEVLSGIIWQNGQVLDFVSVISSTGVFARYSPSFS